jgi:hypothetical protein
MHEEPAVTILGKPVVNDTSCYAAIQALYVRECVAPEDLKIVSVSIDVMFADCMTKALTPDNMRLLARCYV